MKDSGIEVHCVDIILELIVYVPPGVLGGTTYTEAEPASHEISFIVEFIGPESYIKLAKPQLVCPTMLIVALVKAPTSANSQS
ncbi:MAG: hypothetical protein BWX59_02186 [Bacteroidetes bacterium ADurb.Bin028]|nr:MAG: hypothetical protein BWX59_02186 [Bacteroidetes bacterium ADurb.Bin028]